jgi:hypothetical protein
MTVGQFAIFDTLRRCPVHIQKKNFALESSLRFFADYAAKKWPLRGGPSRVVVAYGDGQILLGGLA